MFKFFDWNPLVGLLRGSVIVFDWIPSLVGLLNGSLIVFVWIFSFVGCLWNDFVSNFGWIHSAVGGFMNGAVSVSDCSSLFSQSLVE